MGARADPSDEIDAWCGPTSSGRAAGVGGRLAAGADPWDGSPSGLRSAVANPPQLGISSHVQYDDGSPEKFLLRLWRDLYGDEPVGAP